MRHSPMHPSGRRRAAVLAALLAVVLVASIGPGAAPASAVTLVQDPDRNSGSLTGWGWHGAGTSAATINAFVATGMRITDIEVTSASTPSFSASYVRNSGTYQRTWWWYYGRTASQVSSLLAANGARPIDIEPYATTSGLRFAVVMVANSGAAQKGWWWYYGQSVSGIGSIATAKGARPVDVDRYTANGGTYFSAIFIRNSGVDAASWWHNYRITASTVNDYVASRGARIIDIEQVGFTSTGSPLYDVVMVKGSSPKWWWYTNQTSSGVAAKASQLGARIARLEPYTVDGARRYTVVLINDVDAETSRVRDLVRSRITSGTWGFYLRKVGGSTVVGLQQDTRFEPASMIKVVHALTALREVRDSADVSLTTDIAWFARPGDAARYPTDSDYPDDKDKCAYDTNGAPLVTVPYVDDMSLVLDQMLRQSDNRTTDALVNRYGFDALNATAARLGMTRTLIQHRIGCGSTWPVIWHNTLTLTDAGRLYEAVENGSELGTGSNRDQLYGFMPGGFVGSSSAIGKMITDEAGRAGLSTSETIMFLNETKAWSKGGSYTLCPTSGACDPGTVQVSTVGGAIRIPFKVNGTIVPTSYVYGRFLDNWASSTCTFAKVKAGTCPEWQTTKSAMSTLSVEMFRAVVKQAVASW